MNKTLMSILSLALMFGAAACGPADADESATTTEQAPAPSQDTPNEALSCRVVRTYFGCNSGWQCTQRCDLECCTPLTTGGYYCYPYTKAC